MGINVLIRWDTRQFMWICISFFSNKLSHWSIKLRTLLVEPSEKEIATTLDLSVMMFACQSMGNLTTFQTNINLTKIQTSTSVRFPGVWWGVGHRGDFFLRWRINCCTQAPPTTKKEAWHLLSLFGFGGNIVLIWGVLLWPIYWVIWKKVKATQSYPTLGNAMDYSVPGTLQVRILR